MYILILNKYIVAHKIYIGSIFTAASKSFPLSQVCVTPDDHIGSSRRPRRGGAVAEKFLRFLRRTGLTSAEGHPERRRRRTLPVIILLL